ncbi:MAG: dienelactone hydrolase [Armatimonadetes bacterium]|nr:dienelactone hydrolase [Armatimonadota bacterium]
MHTPSLVALADALSPKDIGVVRFNFPYAEAKRKVPDPQSTLETCYRTVADHVRLRASQLFLGGRSMGGRIASHIVADGVEAAGLVFLSYPLHPPGQPERLRTRHLPKITVPMLFIQGSRDAFARPDLLEDTLKKLPRATLHEIEGADHSLKVKSRAPEDVTQEIADVVAGWIAQHA